MQFQALRLFERATKRVPLIRFPNRKAGETSVFTQQQPQVASAPVSAPPQPQKKGNYVYITAEQAPKRKPISNEEMDMVMLGGVKDVPPPAKPGKSKK